jgi:hypothetical protein
MSEVTYKRWEEYTPLEQTASIWWDMYKDAYNFRPRGVDTSDWTLETFRKEIDYLQEVIERNAALRVIEEDVAIQRFEERIQQILAVGAKDRAMALRWIHEAEDTDGDDEYLCFRVGIPYGYFK